MKIDRPSATIYRLHMASPENSVTDERGSVPIPSALVIATQAKESARAFLLKARRELSEDELASPAARRFLIEEMERLDQICAELKAYEGKYHDQRVEIATLTVEQRKSRWIEILAAVCLSLGSAGIGAAPSYLGLAGGTTLGLVLAAASAVLIVVGIAPRMSK